MKAINEYLNQGMIVEADCKDLRNPRRGCTIYAIQVGKEEKVHKLTVETITKRKDHDATWRTNKYGKTHYNDITFAKNDLGLESWSSIVFGSIEYGPDDVESVESVGFKDRVIIFGINKQVLIDYVKSKASTASNNLAKQIDELKTKLAELEAAKAKQDAIVAKEINENLNNEKPIE